MSGKTYKKEKSFTTFHSNIAADADAQRRRAIVALERALQVSSDPLCQRIFKAGLEDLRSLEARAFAITTMVADEMSRINDEDIGRYLYHRYRYDAYPVEKALDEYPPYLQIEPSSICNYRCVFCYQINKSFTDPARGHMATMPLFMFQEIIDQAQGHIEFLSLSSRGEPLVCADIDAMLRYCRGKFLGLKLNTNASLLTEEHCHAILAGGVNTVVFSVDAADPVQYARMRCNGDLNKVEQNIRRFQKIRREQYSGSRIISRVSGVKLDDAQDISAMIAHWGGLVDQVCFVNHNPWENVYAAEPNGQGKPCSDLWRRMFMWSNGKANPCDVDYLSSLSVGTFPALSIKSLWHSESYARLRKDHLAGSRQGCDPCWRCAVL